MNNNYINNGLNREEIKRRIDNRQINYEVVKNSRSIIDIFKANIFNYFNYLNFGLALLVILSGHYRNILFIFVVFSNIIIGIYQEVKAKIKLDRLKLMVKSTTKVIRNGEILHIENDEIVIDDLILLDIGDQVPSDSIIVEGELLLDRKSVV